MSTKFFPRLFEIVSALFFELRSGIDWILFVAVVPIVFAGLATMNSFRGDSQLFEKQFLWFCISLVVFFVLSFVDFRFFRRTKVITSLFIFTCLILGLLFIAGAVVKGAQSRFDFGQFSFQPVDGAKLVLILLLSKYFSRRHIEIAHFRHIFISALYTGILAFLVLLQPDFGSAIILISIWFGMVLVSGISKKHLLGVLCVILFSSLFLWSFVFKDYQKQRILNFIHPLADIQGTGYNAYQSTIAVGSGQFFGKGVGYGTQSRLKFLPEYETDFIFAAFAEEWGFVGVLLLFALYGVVFWRILDNALHGSTNFEILFGVGVACFFLSHFLIHIRINIGLLAVTGTTVPFMSYGGSHLLAEWSSLGILMGMRKYRKTFHKDAIRNEFVGVE